MDILSTPSPRHFNDSCREGDILKILDDVSRMNLEGSSFFPRHQSQQQDQLAAFLTPPPLNRRRPSFVVTPPQGIELHVSKTYGVDDYEGEQKSPFEGVSRKRLRGTVNRQQAPMLPDSKDFSCTSSTSNSIYGRHIPMYSPIGGVSKLNLDFVAQFETSPSPSPSASSAVPVKHCFQEMSASTTFIANSFPTLEDDESTESKRIRRHGEGAVATRVLKMRRRCKDEYELWDSFHQVLGER
jgi:hypothetical protein